MVAWLCEGEQQWLSQKPSKSFPARLKASRPPIRDGIAKASESINGIEGAWVKGTKAIVRDNKVVEWRVTIKLTFIVS